MTQERANKSGFDTRAIHAGYEPDAMTGAVNPPIYASSTFKQDGVGGLRGGYEYSRSANPTRTALEGAMAAVEEGERGFAFASGLAAEDTIVRSLTHPGDHVVIPDDAYGGTYRLFDKVEKVWGLDHSPAAVNDPAAVAAAIEPGRTKLVWVETPTNPMLNIADIAALAALAHDAGALLVVDNTFASPYLQQPLSLGADVVVHSTTKYVGGHSDVVGGAVVVRDLDLAERIEFHQNAIGAVAGPFDAYLTHRGLKTLGVRMDRHCDNAEQVVEFLAADSRVAEVIYPGLPSHPGHQLAARQMKRFGGMVSFRIAGDEQQALATCARAEVFTLGESLGGVESLIEHPGRMTHASVAGTDLEVPADLIRLSVGIETVEDLIADLDRARWAEVTAFVCVDFGSTFTKAILVDDLGNVLARAAHPTTLPGASGGDVLDGYDACLAALAATDERALGAQVLACSSAGGGLRIAVIGNEELVTAEAGRRVALSSGGKVVAVLFGGLNLTAYDELVAAAPDVVLLVGGTDAGNSTQLIGDAEFLAGSRWAKPVVVAGDVEAQDRVAAAFEQAQTPYVLAANVVPRIGVLAPDSARAAIREMFLAHVIGGKHLSSRGDMFVSMVRGATPDVVLGGVEVLAHGIGAAPGAGDVVVVDVGGATTDVHSVVELDPEDSGLAREVVAPTAVTRTVEGDLGMRWSALSTVEAAEDESLVEAARLRHDAPDFLPLTDADWVADEAIARAAIGLALKRHAGRSKVVLSPEGRVVERTGKDLREVDLLVGSGGALRNGRDGVVRRVLLPWTGEHIEGGWQLPRDPQVVIDHDYVLAAIGLLALEHPDTAHRLAAGFRQSLPDRR